MAAITETVDIDRRPEDVFAYVTDPRHVPDWQESVISVRGEGDAAPSAGKPMLITRRVGRREMVMKAELTDVNPPRSWSVRGLDGPVRGFVKGTVEPLADGARSRVTIVLDFEGHGFGKVLLPLVVLRQARAEVPKNLRKLKELLESGG